MVIVENQIKGLF